MAKISKLISLDFRSSEVKVLFRSLRDDEMASIKNGIFPKDPDNVKYDVYDHIIDGKKATRFISFSSSFSSTCEWAKEDHCHVAVVDLSKLSNQVYDFRQGDNRLGKTTSNFAISSFELCVEGVVPASAIIAVLTPEQVSRLLEKDDKFTKDYFNWGACVASHTSSIKGKLSMVEALAGKPETWQSEEGYMRFTQMVQAFWTYNRLCNKKFVKVDW